MSNQKHIFKLLVKIIYLIDYKDDYTKTHSDNVTKYALLLGKELKLEKETLENKLKMVKLYNN